MAAAASHLSPLAGSWYPDDPGELRELLRGLFESSQSRTGAYLAPRPLAFVAPHAGLMYSGTVAAAVYRHLRAEPPERVILLGFRHLGGPSGAWIPDVEAYRTPLGEVAVDQQVREQLLASGSFVSRPESQLCDHSVEIHLPLLQLAAPQARVAPIYVNQLDGVRREAAARELAKFIGPGTVMVASSDFTHYGRSFCFQPFPPDDLAPERLRDLDETVVDAASSLRPEMFLEALRQTQATVCGLDPIALLLASLSAAGGADEVFQDLLDYQTSGELTGDYQQSVSYAALGYFRCGCFHLEREDQELLLGSARRTLEHYQRTGERRMQPPERETPALARRAAAFVTLHQGGRLRGCVGRRSAGESLAQAIPALTLAAALEDSRFQPLDPAETGIEIEISVLSPFKRVPNLDGFQPGVHGAYLESGQRHALLLPQVATEARWGARKFFDALARKAGLSSDIYRDPATRIYFFRAQILQ
ncbi:MAG: AmmeMemoRadiSam system protein B [Acidobacteria bacterium]|nr:AmmeMemoRadiSam system protein B [Acidobacteriota bacterium]